MICLVVSNIMFQRMGPIRESNSIKLLMHELNNIRGWMAISVKECRDSETADRYTPGQNVYYSTNICRSLILKTWLYSNHSVSAIDRICSSNKTVTNQPASEKSKILLYVICYLILLGISTRYILHLVIPPQYCNAKYFESNADQVVYTFTLLLQLTRKSNNLFTGQCVWVITCLIRLQSALIKYLHN